MPIEASTGMKVHSDGWIAASTWVVVSRQAIPIRLRRRVGRTRRADSNAPASAPTATTELSTPYPDAPVWKTRSANAVSVTGRLIVNIP